MLQFFHKVSFQRGSQRSDGNQAEALASRVVLLARGRIVADGSPAELSGRACTAGLEQAFLALTEVC